MPSAMSSEEAPLVRNEYDSDEESLTSSYELQEWHEPRITTNSGAGNEARARCLFPQRDRATKRHPFRTHLSRILLALILIPILLMVVCSLLFPSYSKPPQHYWDLSQSVELGETGNRHNEKVFVAASLYDPRGQLLSGHWAASVLRLIEILGSDNVFLSIYEDSPDDQAKAAMDAFTRQVTCQHRITAEDLDLSTLPHVRSLEGAQRLKRITFLAEVRNRALRPLQDPTSPAYDTRFDKVLYLNDIAFHPIDAANLLFSTHIDADTGRTRYHAACATDFINPFKFYDTYATRDTAGFDMGLPFYPWFTAAGTGSSRRDVLDQKDAVRVSSCWGGMVAFEAKWFRDDANASITTDLTTRARSPTKSSSSRVVRKEVIPREPTSPPLVPLPLRFRASVDTFWDGSECCFVHADLVALAAMEGPHVVDDDGAGSTGIYMNPFIRVAYSPDVLAWLPYTRRLERLYTPIHSILNWIARRPSPNPRRFQQPGEIVVDHVWTWDDATGTSGHFESVQRPALPGGFCGLRVVSYLNENPQDGGPRWTAIHAPQVS